MLRAYNRASLPRYFSMPSIRCLSALIAAAVLVVPASAFGSHKGRRSRVLLGDASIEPQHDSLVEGRPEAFRLRARASGLATRLRLYIDARSTATSVTVGLYRDAHHRPGALLATGSIDAPRRGAWNTVTFAPVKLVAGRPYWLTVLGQGGTLRYRARRHGHCPSDATVRANLSSLPTAWSAGRIRRHAHCPISAYAVAASVSAPVSLAPPTIVASPPGSGAAEQSLSAPLRPVSPVTTPPSEQTKHEEPPHEEPPREKEHAPPVEPPPAPTNSVLPTVGGTLTSGDVLSSTKGTWNGSPTSYAYRWQDCNTSGASASCTNINGATALSYTLTASDVGHTIRAVVTAKNEGGSTAATSKTTGVVVAAPPPPPPAPTNTKLPAIGGTTTQGQALSATTGSWTESPTSYAYQWQDCNASGEGCADIAGAKASSYTLASSDVGDTIRVVVTATNEGGSTPATSQQTAPVAASTSGGSYPECTQTLSVGATVPSAVSGAAGGSVICLDSGEYGSLTLNATHTSDVTLQAAPGAHVTAGKLTLSGSHMVVRGLWIEGEVALEEGSSFITLDRNDISNLHKGGEGVVFDTSDCTAPNAPSWEGCEPHAPITDVTISANHFHDIGQNGSEDAIHLDNWRNVTVTGNEFDHVIESGSHTDCLQSVYGGTNLTFSRNYEHDNDCQGIFVKDGDATDVTVSDNLFLRDDEPDEAGEHFYNFAQLWNTKNLVVQNNTIWDGKGLALVTEDASFTPTLTMNHNLISNLSVEPHAGTPYTITEGDDIFGESPNKLSEGSGDSVVANPQFKNTATDDYRLASNPNGIGIDWSPAEEQYGPAS